MSPSTAATQNTNTNLANDDLARTFNTALVATRAEGATDFSAEICALVETPAYRSILNAARQLSRLQGITEPQACEQVIQTFRTLDQLWSRYVFQEGLDRLRNAEH